MSSERFLDLDRARAARSERRDADRPVVRFYGRDFALPAEVPFDFAVHHRDGDLRAALGVLFGDQAEEFFALRPSLEDLAELAEGVSRIYGMSSPESRASGTSSSNDGESSRLTSSGSTDSTSETPSRAPERAVSSH